MSKVVPLARWTNRRPTCSFFDTFSVLVFQRPNAFFSESLEVSDQSLPREGTSSSCRPRRAWTRAPCRSGRVPRAQYGRGDAAIASGPGRPGCEHRGRGVPRLQIGFNALGEALVGTSRSGGTGSALVDPFPHEAAEEIRRDDDLPVQGDVDGRDPREFADARNPRRDVPEIDAATQQEPRGRFLQLVDEEDVAQGPAQVGHGHGPEYRRRVHELSRVPEASEPGRDEQQLLPEQALEMFPYGLRAESRHLRQFLQRPPRVVDERVDDPPFEGRHGAGFPPFGQRLSRRFRPQASRQLPNRPRAVPWPRLHGQTAVELPGDPCDLGDRQGLPRSFAVPFPLEEHEEFVAIEEARIDGDHVPLEDPAALEPPKPVAHRRGGEGDATSEGAVTRSRIFMEGDEEPEVLRIHGFGAGRRTG